MAVVAQAVPAITAYADFKAQIAAGMVAHIVPQVREVRGAYIDIPEPGNPGVTIREYDSLKLHALSLQLREPKGAESTVDLIDEGRAVWHGLEVY